MNFSRNNIYKWFLVSLILFFTTTSFAYQFKYTWYQGNKYVYLSEVAKYYGMTLHRYTDNCVLTSKYSKITLPYNSKKSTINDVKTYLMFPVISNNNNPIMYEKDFIYLLDPILRKESLKKHNLKTIVIDPGHGGNDGGATGRSYKEKDLALAISLRLKRLLESKGYNVIMTRDKDVYLPLNTRASYPSKYNGDLFVSIHCNATTNNTTNGIETYIYTPTGVSSTNGGNPTSVKKNGNLHDKNNAKLGYEIQKSLNRADRTDRGLKFAKFAVLKYNTVPSALVEVGFVSSREEEQLLASPEYQQLIATLIANGIIAYHRSVVYGKG